MSRISSTINRGTYSKSICSSSKYLGSPYLINSIHIDKPKRTDSLKLHKFPDYETFKRSLSISLGCESSSEIELIKELQEQIRYLSEENAELKERIFQNGNNSCSSSYNHTLSLQSINDSVRILESELMKKMRDLSLLQNEIELRGETSAQEKKHYDECHRHFQEDIKELRNEIEVLQKEKGKRDLRRDALHSEVNTIIGKCASQKSQQDILRQQLKKRILVNHDLNVELAHLKAQKERENERETASEKQQMRSSEGGSESCGVGEDSVRDSLVYLKGQIAYSKRQLQQKSIQHETEQSFYKSLQDRVNNRQTENQNLEKKKEDLKTDLKNYEKLKLSEEMLERMQKVDQESDNETTQQDESADQLKLFELTKQLELLRYEKSRWQREFELNRQFRMQLEADNEVSKEVDDQLTARENVNEYTELEKTYREEQEKYYERKRLSDQLNENFCLLKRQIHYLDEKAESYDSAVLQLENRLRKLMNRNRRHESQHHRDWMKAEKLAQNSWRHAHSHNHPDCGS